MFVRLGTHKIYYEIINTETASGNKPFLVFLHHGLGSVKQWRDFPHLLSAKLSVPALLYDRPGYGLSSSLKEKKTLEHWAQDVDNLKDLLDILAIKKPVILFGHSDGGTLALMFAAKYPQKVMAVITEAHHLKIEKHTLEGIKKAIDQYENGDLRKRLYPYHKEKTDSVFYNWANLWESEQALSDDIENIVEQITAPILTIQGQEDEYGTMYQVEVIKKKSKNPLTQTLLIDNCRHFPHFEHMEKVIEAVEKFLNSLNL